VNIFADPFENLFKLLFGSDKAIRRNRMVTALVKDINGSRFKHFYRVFGSEVTPQLAAYFFELYKACAHPQITIKHADGTAELKKAVLGHFLDDDAWKLIKKLDNECLDGIFKSDGKKALLKHLENTINTLREKLNGTLRANVDRCYKNICSFIWFINFDYYALLKEFNTKLNEYSFHDNQRFARIKARRITENIKDFLAIAEGINFGSDWETAFAVLNKFKPAAGISVEYWKQAFDQLKDILSSTILLLIVRHATEDPEWKNKIIIPREIIAGPFLNRITDNARKRASDTINNEKSNKTNGITFSLFGSEYDMSMARFYVEAHNEQYENIGIIGFTHTEAFNYSIVFLSLYFEKIKDICDIFIIYGKWRNKEDMYGLSQTLYELNLLNDNLPAYDKTLSDTGERGYNLKRLEAALVRGRQARHNLSAYVDSINNEIFILINRMINSLSCLCVFLGDFKSQKEDSLKKIILNPETISDMLNRKRCNTKEVERKAALFLELLSYLDFETDVT
jgi:hypothetical protein